MASDLYPMSIGEIEKYTKEIIPKLEKALSDNSLEKTKKLELLKLYRQALVTVAPNDFVSFNKVIEFYEDKDNEGKNFYGNRQIALGELFEAMNDMEIYDKYDTLIVCMPPRVGKMVTDSTGVLTPKGWKPIGEMVVGDNIIGSDGNTYTTIGVYPQGKKDVYRVTFDDDTYVDAGLEHLWTVQNRKDRSNGTERTISTEEMMKDLYCDNGTRKNYSIKYIKPSEFENTLTGYDIHPYVLGVLIGDGCITKKKHFSITGIDMEIIDKVSKFSNFDITSKGKAHRMSNCDELERQLSTLGLLGTYSDTKFIPKKYLYTSVQNRIELLQGLMDTDGCTSKDNRSYCEYTTVSERLADDVCELVRSLGGRAKITTKIGSYKKDGIKVECKKVYRVIFNMEINPFYVSRKRSIFTPRTNRKYKYISSIEKVGNESCTCIEVDAPDHLYIVDGYNLTHNTTTGIRFLSWIIGRYPEYTQMATSYADSVTRSFYNGVMDIVQSEEFKECFPESPLVSQNAKLEQISLRSVQRYPSILFVPIDGSMTGRGEAGKYMYCDDLVSGIEEAVNQDRLSKLWEKYTVNVKQRKKKGCKEIHVATPWSVHDVITKVRDLNSDNERCKIIKLSCYDENGESNFDYLGGFDTKYYKDLEMTMDDLSFRALYLQDPIEREGILYHEDDLKYYIQLPNGEPDGIFAVCDSKNLGSDSVACPIAYMYGNDVYIEDVVFNSGLPEVTKPLVADKLYEHNVHMCDFELNNGGNYFATDVSKLLKDKYNADTRIRLFNTTTNKITKIITYSDFVKKNFYFKDKSCYTINSEYYKFMQELLKFSQTGKNKHDDAPDAVAMLAEMIEGFRRAEVKILSRKDLRI